MEPGRRPGQLVASSHGRRLLAVVWVRVHAWPFLDRRRGDCAGGGELWGSAATTAAVAAVSALAAAVFSPVALDTAAHAATAVATLAAVPSAVAPTAAIPAIASAPAAVSAYDDL